jgi:protein phosphatase
METTAAPTLRKPRDEEIDIFGLTHAGKVRRVNQDNFLICAMRKSVAVYASSLDDADARFGGSERVGLVAMVADGVGGGLTGDAASRLALEAVMQYVNRTMRCYSSEDETDDAGFAKSLQAAALASHEDILRQAEENPAMHGMATTLTLWLGVWPRAYILQVGDSRCYAMRDGELRQITRDQTMAQELVDAGALNAVDAKGTRWAHVLSSSIGGPQTAPVVHRVNQYWGQIGLLCSDGLTKHVSDDRIRERLLGMSSAREGCETLLQDALDAGGSDNITIVIGRTVGRPDT